MVSIQEVKQFWDQHMREIWKFNKIDPINLVSICVFPAGPALCQMRCHRWPAQGCPSLKWMSGRSRQLSKRSRLGSKRWRWLLVSKDCDLWANAQGSDVLLVSLLPVGLNLTSLLRNRGSRSFPRGPPSPPLIRRQFPPPGALSAQHQPSTSSPHPAALTGTAKI